VLDGSSLEVLYRSPRARLDEPRRPCLHLRCPACDEETEHKPIFAVNDCDIIQCACCGVGRATAADFKPDSYYTESYFNGGHADGYPDYQGSINVLLREFKTVVQELERFVPVGSHVLEIGCAYGFFLKAARSKFKVTGIEIAESAVQSCHRNGLDVYQGVVSARLLENIGQVDAVVLLDVIEHLPDPENDLRLLVQALKPGGIVMISTGDFSSVLARKMGPKWRLMTPPQHLWYFTPKGIATMAKRLGLETISIAYPWKTVPLGVILIQIARMFRVRLKYPIVASCSSIGVRINLFDAMRVIFTKPQ
jgi:2-polyprenyl-3-methyl-5-hydroxy-6-metoxy-1,4-benzoquinol methylase